jgi:hypothetical protein
VKRGRGDWWRSDELAFDPICLALASGPYPTLFINGDWCQRRYGLLGSLVSLHLNPRRVVMRFTAHRKKGSYSLARITSVLQKRHQGEARRTF